MTQMIVKLRERDGQGVDVGRSLKGYSFIDYRLSIINISGGH